MGFHTQANLSQALSSILVAHHASIQTATEGSKGNQIPSFAAEALHQICFNLAGVADNSAVNVAYWKNIANLAGEVTQILEQPPQPTPIKGNTNESTDI